LSELGEALELYGALPEFDREDLEDALTDIRQEIEKLPQKHSELWDIFKSVKNRMDEEAYELELAKEDVRQKFYTKLSAYSRALGIALSTVQFNLETPEEKIERYKKDLAFFQKLRVSVKKRYSDEIDYKEYEAKVQKLINTHVSSEEILQITPPVNIFEQEKFQAEVEKLQTAASKADTIAHRTKRTITEKMEEDPYFYRRFSKILEEAIEAYREQRISDAEYLSRVTEIMNSVVNRAGDDLPSVLKNQDVAKAFYGVVNEVFTRLSLSGNESKEVAARAALQIDEIIRRNKVVDWIANFDAQNAMRNEIDDYLYELREESGIELSLDDMDLIVENSIDIAKARYA
jgi:type I restriction enzyme R subunit